MVNLKISRVRVCLAVRKNSSTISRLESKNIHSNVSRPCSVFSALITFQKSFYASCVEAAEKKTVPTRRPSVEYLFETLW